MNITFLQDYRGVKTSERFFQEGTVLDLEDEKNEGIDGDGLIEDGRAKKGGTVKKAKAEKKVENKD